MICALKKTPVIREYWGGENEGWGETLDTPIGQDLTGKLTFELNLNTQKYQSGRKSRTITERRSD
jgi:hypothetical protein